MNRLTRTLSAFTDGVWGPIRQMAMVATMRPDWESAPRTFRGLAWYAGLLLAFVFLARLAQAAPSDVAVAAAVAVDSGQAFLEFTLKMAFFVCFYSALGRFVVFWNCIARTASPLALMAIVYSVSTVDHGARLVMQATTPPGESLQTLLGFKDLATTGLAIMVLVDFFRPRPPRKPRRKPAEHPVLAPETTRPAPV